MAEKKTTKAQVEKVEEVVKAEPSKAKAKVVEEKFVKVTPKISGKKFIGNRWYNLVADKELEVTQDTKRVLLEAKAIYI